MIEILNEFLTMYNYIIIFIYVTYALPVSPVHISITHKHHRVVEHFLAEETGRRRGGEMERWRDGEVEIRGDGEVEIWRDGDTKRWRHVERWRHGETGKRRGGDAERRGNEETRRWLI